MDTLQTSNYFKNDYLLIRKCLFLTIDIGFYMISTYQKMTRLKLMTYPKVAEVFEHYPQPYSEKLLFLRQLILETAEEMGLEQLEETLKWGQPSYLAKKGSTIRLGLKKADNLYAIYFKCTSKLVATFKEIYGNLFNYEKTRAIEFTLTDEVPVTALKHCISMALQYHKVKKLPLLGATPKLL